MKRFSFSLLFLIGSLVYGLGFGRYQLFPFALGSSLTKNSDPLVTKVNLECFRNELVKSAIKKKDLSDFIRDCGKEIEGVIKSKGLIISADQLQMIAANIVSHNFAPYGGSKALKYNKLIEEKVLDCDNYAALLGHLVNPNIADEIHFIGFDGGKIGNHAQVFFTRENEEMLLDPTVSSVTFTDYESLFESSNSRRRVFVFNRQKNDELNSFYANVDKALSKSLYKASDILYYYFNLSHFIGDFKYPWITPGGYRLYKRQQNRY